MADVIEVVDQLFAAIEAGDAAAVEALYDDDVAVWHSVTRRSLDKARSLAILQWIMAPGVTRAYEIEERLVDGDRVAQRHVLHVTVGDHPTLELPVAIFITARDGQITAIEEYVDQAGTDKLIELIPPG
jgi:ketosteroid isomerase-like protein